MYTAGVGSYIMLNFSLICKWMCSSNWLLIWWVYLVCIILLWHGCLGCWVHVCISPYGFLVVLCWIVIDYWEFVLHEVISFMFIFLLCKYNYCSSFVCFCYGKFICRYFVLMYVISFHFLFFLSLFLLSCVVHVTVFTKCVPAVLFC
jgi:hypothetical protein